MDFFRGFFGFPPRRGADRYDDTFDDINRGRFTPQQPPDWNDNEDDDEYSSHDFHHDSWPDGHHGHFSFNIFTEPLEIHRYFEQQMDEMMKAFGTFAHSSVFDDGFPSLGPPADDHGETWQPGSLRDQMLKDNDAFHYRSKPRSVLPLPEERVDTDLDDRIAAGELGKILTEKQEEPPAKEPTVEPPSSVMPFTPKQWSFGNSVVTKTIKRGDGVVEHRRMVKDSQGNEVTTVTRTIGDQSHCTTTRRDPAGTEEKEEAFINIDEKNMDDFDKKWHESQHTSHPDYFSRPGLLAPRGSPGDTVTESIFRKLFGF